MVPGDHQENSAEIIVVSGLPRSGTSMMMKMLTAGGLEVVTDNLRADDEDNLLGYFEDERVKDLARDNTWITPAFDGKVLKVISMLLYHLPPALNYKVVFLRRGLEEVLASQRKMLARRGETDAGPDNTVMAAKFEEHLAKVAEWLDCRNNIETLYLDYSAAVAAPRECAARVKKFLGRDLNLDEMAEAVVPSMYRNRSN
ncbi:MAG: sulfotransferase domain-containing protein [Candidatus Glassbacteria bacterium]|nr:sulfotransferase domain-containing protein [Candidatus Glassbacteria bacterium]